MKGAALFVLLCLGACGAPQPPPSQSTVQRNEVEQWRRQWFEKYRTCVSDAADAWQRERKDFSNVTAATFAIQCAATRNSAMPTPSEPGMMEEFRAFEAGVLVEIGRKIAPLVAEAKTQREAQVRTSEVAGLSDQQKATLLAWTACIRNEAARLDFLTGEPARDIAVAAFQGCRREQSNVFRGLHTSEDSLEARRILDLVTDQTISMIVGGRAIRAQRRLTPPSTATPGAPLTKPRPDGPDT